MDFIVELLNSLFYFLIFLGCGVFGAFVGKLARERKNAKRKEEAGN